MLELICFGPPGSEPQSCTHTVVAFIYVGEGEDPTPLAAGIACACHEPIVEWGLMQAVAHSHSMDDGGEFAKSLLELVQDVKTLEAMYESALSGKDRLN